MAARMDEFKVSNPNMDIENNLVSELQKLDLTLNEARIRRRMSG
jgi:hypothetical protein